MKTLILLVALALPVAFMPACANRPPSARVIEVQTLKSVKDSAEFTLGVSAQLFRDKKITEAQAREALDFYNLKFLPPYKLAVSMVQANLDSLAHPEILGILNQFAALVASYQKPKTP